MMFQGDIIKEGDEGVATAGDNKVVVGGGDDVLGNHQVTWIVYCNK